MVKITKKCTRSQQNKFLRCEKKVIKTVVPRKGSTKRGAAIAICRVAIGCK